MHIQLMALRQLLWTEPIQSSALQTQHICVKATQPLHKAALKVLDCKPAREKATLTFPERSLEISSSLQALSTQLLELHAI